MAGQCIKVELVALQNICMCIFSEKDAEFSCYYSATCLDHRFPVLVCYRQTI